MCTRSRLILFHTLFPALTYNTSSSCLDNLLSTPTNKVHCTYLYMYPSSRDVFRQTHRARTHSLTRPHLTSYLLLLDAVLVVSARIPNDAGVSFGAGVRCWYWPTLLIEILKPASLSVLLLLPHTNNEIGTARYGTVSSPEHARKSKVRSSCMHALIGESCRGQYRAHVIYHA